MGAADYTGGVGATECAALTCLRPGFFVSDGLSSTETSSPLRLSSARSPAMTSLMTLACMLATCAARTRFLVASSISRRARSLLPISSADDATLALCKRSLCEDSLLAARAAPPAARERGELVLE